MTFKQPLHDSNMSSFYFFNLVHSRMFFKQIKVHYILFVIWFQKVFDLFLKFRAFLTVKSKSILIISSQLLLELLNFQYTTLYF